MSGHDEEMLSAYIDGELSGEDRSSVEQWLADDVAARELLDELTETSTLVRALPRPTAPEDLRNEVLNRLRATPAATPRSPAFRPGWRRPAVWVTASAAGLLAALGLYLSWPATVQMRVADVQARRSEAVADFGVEFAAPADRFGTNVDAIAVTSGGETDLAFLGEQDPKRLAYANSSALQERLVTALKAGEAPVPGEALEQLGQLGDQVVIFRHRVVDTQDMLDKVQVVLSNNGIVAVDGPKSGESLEADGFRDGQLHAIYLDAPPTVFTTALNEITDLDTITAVTTNTVSLTVDDQSNHLAAAVPQSLHDEIEPARAAEQESILRRSAAAAQPGAEDADGEGVVPAPVVAPVPAQTAASLETLAESKAADQPADQEASTVEENRSRSSSRDYSALGAGQARQKPAAYQMVVPARQELMLGLERPQDGAIDRGSNSRLADSPESAKLTKRVYQQFWRLPSPGEPGHDNANRVRAVILLVPEQP